MNYYMVEDKDTGMQFVCKTDTKWRVVAKANNFWYSNEDYIVLGCVTVKEITKKEYDKYVD